LFFEYALIPIFEKKKVRKRKFKAILVLFLSEKPHVEKN